LRLIGLAVVLTLTLLAPCAAAQHQGKVWRIGVLSMAPAAETPVFDAFRKALQELVMSKGKTFCSTSVSAPAVSTASTRWPPSSSGTGST
jgi:hypothetical protein